MASAEELKRQMTVERERLLKSIAGVSEQQFKRRPPATADDPEPWCIAEVLAHLLATERIWAGRIDLALRQDGASVQASDPAQNEASVRAGRVAPVPQLIHGLLASQREMERLIERTGAEDGFERALEHTTRGRITVGWMLQTYAVDHIGEHVAQIQALKAELGG